MNPLEKVSSQSLRTLLDVGCNVGALLHDCSKRFPDAKLSGVEINETALAQAKQDFPQIDFQHAGAEKLPFADESFQYVTCCEVLEHVAPDLRMSSFCEMRRVLELGGYLILTVPHAGWFAWLDSNNFRHRFPRIYAKLIGKGNRDENYKRKGRMVEWHYHFTIAELEKLMGQGWRKVTISRGGLVLCPLMDCFSWPFYRWGKSSHFLRILFEKISNWESNIDFGTPSYRILIVLEKTQI